MTPEEIIARRNAILQQAWTSMIKNLVAVLGVSVIPGSQSSLAVSTGLKIGGVGVGIGQAMADIRSLLGQLKQLQADIAASKSTTGTATIPSVTIVGNPAVTLPPFHLYRDDTGAYWINSSGDKVYLPNLQVTQVSPASPSPDTGVPFKNPQVHGPAPSGVPATPPTKPLDVKNLPPPPPPPPPAGSPGSPGGGTGPGGGGSGSSGGGTGSSGGSTGSDTGDTGSDTGDTGSDTGDTGSDSLHAGDATKTSKKQP